MTPREAPPACLEILCEQHHALASPAALARRERAEARLRLLQECWDDDAYFDELVASGKYLKMCGTLARASEAAERAWENVKADVLSGTMPSPVREHALNGFA
ncbi:MAG: hypothetical protein NVSMB26_23180 [Beijerinckiaceae bacterium]